jgi:hypothetical protein
MIDYLIDIDFTPIEFYTALFSMRSPSSGKLGVINVDW